LISLFTDTKLYQEKSEIRFNYILFYLKKGKDEFSGWNIQTVF
jgi:hypothetical protein